MSTTSGTDGWTVSRGRYELGEGARWCHDGLVHVDLLAGVLLRDDRILARVAGPLGAVAPVRGTTDTWIAAVADGVALLRPRRPLRGLARFGPGIRVNDGCCDQAGRFWVTTIALDATRGGGALHRVDPDGRATTVLTGLDVPNGPAFGRNGTTMYLADSARGTIGAYPVGRNGELGRPRPFARVDATDGKPDGMTVDDDGLVWVALWGGARVRGYSPDGDLTHEIPVPTVQPTSIAFGGGRVHVTTARLRLTSSDPLAGAVLSRPSAATAPAAAPYGEPPKDLG